MTKPVLDLSGSTTWQSQLGASERQQQQHYDSIAADYEVRYSDEWSVEYRRRFIYEPMFAGLDLAGKQVLDAMCGSGQTTSYLGHFCFMEPHTGSFADTVRQIWYRFDRFFSDNEAAIDITRLQKDFADRFTLKKADYLGNVAFLLVLNSLIFRIPPGSKKLFAPTLMKFEPLINKLQTKFTSCFAVAQWQKNE